MKPAQSSNQGVVSAPGYVPAADARTAASLLLLRDGAEGLEVLMLRRAERDGDMRSGAAVFPGGVLDARDREAHGHCLGPDDTTASAWLGVAEGGLDYLVAAVRETFEEVGLLLFEHDMPSATGDAFDLLPLHPWRERLNNGEVGVAQFCRDHGLKLDLRGLVYFSHWLTPPGQPKRFDTRFFVTHAPRHQVAQADLGEAVELMWITPKAALAPERGLKLLPVTQETLRELAASGTASQAIAAAQARKRVSLTMPRRANTARGPRVVLPHELPYAEVARLDPDGLWPAFSDLLPGRVVRLSPSVLRVTAPNPGPMTGPGTNTYLLSAPTEQPNASTCWTVIDPGPDMPAHIDALIAAAAPGRITQILVTHTHRDHSPAALTLAQATGAAQFGRIAAHPEWQDVSFVPQRELQHGERLELGNGATLRVIHTPGHASNHLCYLLEEEATLFTGDHVMQGSTVVINPPDGDMSAYLQALRELLDLPLQWLAPGHGFLVDQPHAVLQALIKHRLKREAKVRAAVHALSSGTLQDLLPLAYDDVPAALHAMAARSLLAHLIKLERDGEVAQQDQRWRSVALS